MTSLTTTEIAQLTARLLGEAGYKRAASKDAATQRFYSVASTKGIAVVDAAQVLEAATFEEAQALLKSATDNMIRRAEAEELAISDQHALEDAAEFYDRMVANGGTNEGMGRKEPTIPAAVEAAFGMYLGMDDRSDKNMRDFLHALYITAFDAGAASAKPARQPRERKPRAESGQNKRQIAADLLTREGGCTAKDILDATGWPAVSVPAIAKASGIALRQEKEGRTTRYFGSAA